MLTVSRLQGFRAHRKRHAPPAERPRITCETLENRTLLSFPPFPVIPGPGESQILQNALRFARNNQLNPWNNMPIPFAVVGTNVTTGAVNIAKNNPNAGNNSMRVDIDVDSNPNTGSGGKDVAVSVSTELFFDSTNDGIDNPTLNPHLLATYDRLGSAPFAQNFEILVSFPFAAFAPEFFSAGSIADPNLFMGYRTFGAASTGPDNGPGGIAPLREQIRLVPNLMLGANHPLVQIQLATTSASNPLQFITGYFGGTDASGVLDAAAYTAWTQTPPATAAIGVGVGNSLPPGSPFSGSINLDWRSSSRTRVVFDYREEEDGALGDSDFDTTITFDQIANHENITLAVNEAGEGTYSLTHTARNAADTLGQTTNLIQVRSTRNDGLVVIGSATDVPPDVSVGIGLDGTTEGAPGSEVPAVQLDVTPLGAGPGAHVNTLDLKLEIMKTKGGGFLNTSEFLGYNLGYVALSGNNLPDLTAGYIPDDPGTPALDPGIGIKAKNPGESIGWVEVVADDDAHYGAIVDGFVMHDGDPSDTIETPDDLYTGVVDNRPVEDGLVKADLDQDGVFESNFTGVLAGMPVVNGRFDVNGGGVGTSDDQAQFLVGLATPPNYYSGLPNDPTHHLFSLVDDGTHGTAVARILGVVEATLNLDAEDIADIFTLNLAEPAPLTGYLRTTATSNIIPDHDVEVTLNIVNIPAGISSFNMSYPTDFKYDLPDGAELDEIHAFGHIDCMFFDVLLQDLPNKLEFSFDPDGAVSVLALDSDDNPDVVGAIVVHLWHQDIPGFECPDEALLPDSPLPNLLGAELQEARLRLDDIPSFDATWSDDDDGTSIDFDTLADTGGFAFLGGAQVALSTVFDPENPSPELLEALPASPHYLTFHDEGTDTAPDPDVPLRKDFAVGAFGINNFTYASSDPNATYALSYEADSAHVLNVTFDSRFGGRFFPQYDVDLTLNVNAVPTEFKMTSDLATQFNYEASSGIAGITLAGTIDDTNQTPAVDDGFDVTFGMIGLPSAVRFGIITAEVKVFDGRLDVDGNGSINGDDDGLLAGAPVIDGRLDLDGNGTADDAGTYFGIAVIGGELDIDASGAVDGNDDGGLAGAELFASGPTNTIAFQLESETNARGIFGEDYRLIQALATDLPARLVLSYGGDRFFLDTSDGVGGVTNADALGEISVLISTSNNDTDANANKLLPFTLVGPVDSGGAILNDPAVTGAGPGGSRIQYSHFLQEIDRRYYNAEPGANPSDVLTRLAELYADGERLSGGEDHLIVRKEDLANDGGDDGIGFATFNFNDFQHASWTPDANGGAFRYAAPGRGDDPFFAGMEEDDVFTTLQIDHVPDSIVVDIDKTNHVVYEASTSPGDIDLYRGPGNNTDGLFASEADDAMRAILRDAPANVRIFWDFSFPDGGAFMDTDSPGGFELLFLTQDGSTRITAGVHLEDLHIGWGIDVLSFDVTKQIEIWNPFGDNFTIDIAWELFQFRAGIDNDADDLLDDLSNVGDPGQIGGSDNIGIAGFFTLYNLDPDPEALNNGGPGADGGEYVPFISVQSEGFQSFFMDFLVELDPTNLECDFFPIDLEFNVDTSNVGNLVFDVWTEESVHFTDGDDIPFIPEVGFTNPADYIDNTPIHILPGLLPFPEGTIANAIKGLRVAIPDTWVFTFDGWHAFADHFDPFDGTPDPFDGSSDTGTGINPGDVGFLVETVGPFNGALDRWQGALVAAGMSEDDANNLMNDIANNTDILVGNFAGSKIGEASGNSGGATIRIDPDGGGFEWFVDPTPFDGVEFDSDGIAPGSSPAFGKVDMLTFFVHEIGHILGLTHTETGVMRINLPTGRRRTPDADDATPGAPPDPAPAGDDTSSALHVLDEEEVPGLLA